MSWVLAARRDAPGDRIIAPERGAAEVILGLEARGPKGRAETGSEGEESGVRSVVLPDAGDPALVVDCYLELQDGVAHAGVGLEGQVAGWNTEGRPDGITCERQLDLSGAKAIPEPKVPDHGCEDGVGEGMGPLGW